MRNSQLDHKQNKLVSGERNFNQRYLKYYLQFLLQKLKELKGTNVKWNYEDEGGVCVMGLWINKNFRKQ